MSNIFGHLNISDSDRIFATTVGQGVIWDTATSYLDRVNAQLAQALSIFVGETTEDFKRRYKLPGGGTLQRRNAEGRYAHVKATGSWDVAFPLEDFGASIAWDDIDYRYLTVRELNNHIDTVVAQNINTTRFELLKSLLNNTQRTFVDRNGSLLIEPLANGDAVVYPPVDGTEDEATDNHYLGANYLASAISDSNNPFPTIREELEEHFGVSEGGSNIVVFHNNAQTAKIEALTDFDEVPDRFVNVGTNTDVPKDLKGNIPGVLKGRVSGVWSVEWRWMPANYMFGIYLDAPKPVVRRVSPAFTGLGAGLRLVAKDEVFPFESPVWRNIFGFGVGNRLNGVAMHVTNSASYTIPTIYA